MLNALEGTGNPQPQVLETTKKQTVWETPNCLFIAQRTSYFQEAILRLQLSSTSLNLYNRSFGDTGLVIIETSSLVRVLVSSLSAV